MSDALPRGVRNRNPGNLRLGQHWEGLCQQQADPDFCQFIDTQHGIRALAITLRNYQLLHALKTVRQMINRWAPPADNNPTSAYVEFVAGQMGVDPDASVDTSDATTLRAMVCAIIAQECARYVYPDDVVSAALALAGMT